MKETKRNHYLSQCISKNFITEGNKMFWQYDCSGKKQIVAKNITRLYSELRIWNQELEDCLSHSWENELAEDLKYLVNKKMQRVMIPGREGFVVPQFHIEPITDVNMEKRLSKLIFQTILLQRKNAKEKDIQIEKNIKEFYERDFSMKLPVSLVEINPIVPYYPPLILVDGMLFIYYIPHANKKNGTSGHIAFMFPISTKRMLIWGNREALDYFCQEYQNIHYLNLCRIEQQNKKCKIATQNKQYMEILVPQIDGFYSKAGHVQIKIQREWT